MAFFASVETSSSISLLNTGYKICVKIIAKRLTVIAEALLLEEQNGFRKGQWRTQEFCSEGGFNKFS